MSKPDPGTRTATDILTVLIVEDDGAMRELIKRVIGDLAEGFWECGDGGDALDLYEKHRPAWVLMDIRMEHVDGLTATQQITTAWPSARVLVVTPTSMKTCKKQRIRPEHADTFRRKICWRSGSGLWPEYFCS